MTLALCNDVLMKKQSISGTTVERFSQMDCIAVQIVVPMKKLPRSAFVDLGITLDLT